MSAAYAPEPDDRPDRPTPPGELSVRDQQILDDIAGHENGSDPAFVARLRERESRRPASSVTDRVIQVLIVAVVLGLLLPTAWVMVGVIVTVLVVIPALLAWYGRGLDPGTRPDGHDPRSAR